MPTFVKLRSHRAQILGHFMFKPIVCYCLLPAIIACFLLPEPLAGQSAPRYISSMAVGPEGTLVLLSEGDSLVRMIAPDTGKTGVYWRFNQQPGGLFVRSDSLWVTSGNVKGRLSLLLAGNPGPIYETETGYSPNSPIVDSKGQWVYVCCRFINRVERFDAATGKKSGSVEVLREPVAAALSPNDSWLFVANFLPAGRADSQIVSAQVSVIDLKNFQKWGDISLPNGSNALRHMQLSPDGKYLYVTHNLGRFQVPTSQLHQGWMNTSALSVIDVEQKRYVGTLLLDEPSRGAAGSWGIAADSDWLVVAHSGTHDISIIDHKAMISRFEAYESKENLAYDLHFLYGIRRRVPIYGNGPRAICFNGGEIQTVTYFSDTLNRIDPKSARVHYVALNPARKENAVQKGRRIYNDASYCLQNWQSCNGCHPGEGRTDGMNWDLMNDGIGNPKNCKSLLLSHVTPPNMISGIRANAEMAVKAGFSYIQFMEVPDSIAGFVDEYLKNLQPLPSPRLIKGKLSPLARRGQTLFNKLGCAECHSGPLYTDLQMHRIGPDLEFEKGWDTPTLIEVWRTAPYLFDGRAATLEELISVHRHGITGKLSRKETEALSEFVKSL